MKVEKFKPSVGLFIFSDGHIVVLLVQADSSIWLIVIAFLHEPGWTSSRYQESDLGRDRFSGKQIADVPVVVLSQVPVIQKMQKTVEVPQMQFIDKVIDAMQRLAQPIDKVVDVPEV